MFSMYNLLSCFSVIFSLYVKDLNGVLTKDDMVSYTAKYANDWNLEHITSLFDEVIPLF